jgi:hypothetical protein
LARYETRMTEGWVIEADYMSSKAVDQVLDCVELFTAAFAKASSYQVDHNRKLNGRL